MKTMYSVSLVPLLSLAAACTFIDDFGSFRACDVAAQDCPTGYACVALENGSPECRAAGQSCESATDCVAGLDLECVGSPGRCQYACSMDSDCDEREGGRCGDSQITSVDVCTVDCDLRTGLPCGSDLTCGAGQEDGTYFTTCVAAGDKQVGEQCDAEHPCGPGLLCLEGDGPAASRCFQWCQTLADCEANQVCVQAVEIQGQAWGLCTLP